MGKNLMGLLQHIKMCLTPYNCEIPYTNRSLWQDYIK